MKIVNVTTIGKIYAKWFFRRPLTYMFITIFMPLSIITPLLLVSTSVNWPRIIIGSALFSVIGGGISDVTMNVSFDRHMGRIVFFMTRPVQSMEYMIGIMLGGATYTFVSAGIILTTGYFVLKLHFTALQTLLLASIIVLTWFISANIGFVISLYGPKDFRLAGTLSDFVLFSITFIAPVYYSILILPQTLQSVSQILYTTDLALMANHVVGISPLPNPIFDIAYPLIFGLALFVISIRRLKWMTI